MQGIIETKSWAGTMGRICLLWSENGLAIYDHHLVFIGNTVSRFTTMAGVSQYQVTHQYAAVENL